jgi:hypothetical protein
MGRDYRFSPAGKEGVLGPALEVKNPKSEIRNPKEIQNSRNPKF